MSSISPLREIIEDPAAKVLFILDTTGSAMGSDLHEQAFEFLRVMRSALDPKGDRTAVITDKFARLGKEQVDPEILPVSARTDRDIPPGQISYAGGGARHPLEAIGSTELFKDYRPTHLVFVGDLFDTVPSAQCMSLPADKVLFLMWNSTDQTLAEMSSHYKQVGHVSSLFEPGEIDYLRSIETADALAATTNAVLPPRSRHRF